MDLNETGFLKYNNIEIINLTENECQAKLTITKHALNPYGIVHGGLTFALGDTAMGVLCHAMGKNVVTLDSNINYLKPGKGSFLLAIPKLIKMGKTTCVLKAEIFDENNTLIATMSGTYYIVG